VTPPRPSGNARVTGTILWDAQGRWSQETEGWRKSGALYADKAGPLRGAVSPGAREYIRHEFE